MHGAKFTAHFRILALTKDLLPASGSLTAHLKVNYIYYNNFITVLIIT